jgi:hypothetical protein
LSSTRAHLQSTESGAEQAFSRDYDDMTEKSATGALTLPRAAGKAACASAMVALMRSLRASSELSGMGDAYGVELSLEAAANAARAAPLADLLAAVEMVRMRVTAESRDAHAGDPDDARGAPTGSWQRGEPVSGLVRALQWRWAEAAAEGFGSDVDAFAASLDRATAVAQMLIATGSARDDVARVLLDHVEQHLGTKSAYSRVGVANLRMVADGSAPMEEALFWQRLADASEMVPGSSRTISVAPEDPLLPAVASVAALFTRSVNLNLRTIAVALVQARRQASRSKVRPIHTFVGAADDAHRVQEEDRAIASRLLERFRVGCAFRTEPPLAEEWDARSGAWGLLLRSRVSAAEVLKVRDANQSLQQWWGGTTSARAMLSLVARRELPRSAHATVLARLVGTYCEQAILPEAHAARSALGCASSASREDPSFAVATALAALVEGGRLGHAVEQGEVPGRAAEPVLFASAIVRFGWAAAQVPKTLLFGEQDPWRLAKVLVEIGVLLDPEAHGPNPLSNHELHARHTAELAQCLRRVMPNVLLDLSESPS